MKVFFVIISFMFLSLTVLGTEIDKKLEKRIIIKIESEITVDKTLKSIIKLGFEEIATQNNYSIVDDDVSQKAYQQILKDSKWKENDKKFLQKFGKQLSANNMVIIKIIPQNNNFLLSNQWVDLQNGVILKTKNLLFNDNIENNYNYFYGKVQTLARNFITSKEENPIIIKTESDLPVTDNLDKIIKLAFEEIATQNNYSIVDDELRQKAINRIITEKNWKENDPKFLPELGKQLAAKEMVVIKITKKGENDFLFSNQLISLENGLVTETKTINYSNKNDKNNEILFLKTQKLAQTFLCKTCSEKSVVYIDVSDKIDNSFKKSILMGFSEILTQRGIVLSKEKNNDIDLIFSIELNNNLLNLTVLNKEGNTVKSTNIDKTNKDNLLSKSKESALSYFGENIKTIISKYGIIFSEIPKGSFYMGSNADDANEYEKTNYKKVEIPESFYISQFEITQEQFENVMKYNNSVFKSCSKCPIENISYKEILNFIEKLNENDEEYTYRLPTEGEWEYAARAGSETPFYFGNSVEVVDNYAWYKTNSNNKTHNVGEKKPNKWNLYDTIGNVFEMTSTGLTQQMQYFDSKTNKIVSTEINFVVIKGGSFKGENSFLKLTIGGKIPQKEVMVGTKKLPNTSGTIGFRLVLNKKNKK